MIELKRGQELHERLCRDEVLTLAEKVELDEWYAQMDADEQAQLRSFDSGNASSLAELRSRLDQETRVLQQTVTSIQILHASNDNLRQEINDLKIALAGAQPQIAR